MTRERLDIDNCWFVFGDDDVLVEINTPLGIVRNDTLLMPDEIRRGLALLSQCLYENAKEDARDIEAEHEASYKEGYEDAMARIEDLKAEAFDAGYAEALEKARDSLDRVLDTL